MSVTLKWSKIPGESGFEYATHKGVRVAHVVKTGDDWTGFVTYPELKWSCVERKITDAKRRIRQYITEHN